MHNVEKTDSSLAGIYGALMTHYFHQDGSIWNRICTLMALQLVVVGGALRMHDVRG